MTEAAQMSENTQVSKNTRMLKNTQMSGVRRFRDYIDVGSQPVMLTVPVSMCPVARRVHAESELTVTVKSYQPLL